MATFTVIMRDGSANAVDSVTRLQVKIGGVTGTPAGPFYTATVAATDEDRWDAIRNSLANDPLILSVGGLQP